MSGPQTAEGWVLKLARDRSDLSPSELHVLITLAARHNRDVGAAHPRIELLHRETHISMRQLLRIVNALADPRRSAGPLLHISYGPLPIEGKYGQAVHGNVYRFVGFDAIPASARPRRLLGGRPPASDDTTSTEADDMVSSQADDTGDGVQMTPATGADDTGDTRQMTSANSPLYPVKNPVKNPDLNPARERARSGPPKVPLFRECPECHQQVRSFGLDGKGKGHAPECWRFELSSSHPWFDKPRAEIESELAAAEVRAAI